MQQDEGHDATAANFQAFENDLTNLNIDLNDLDYDEQFLG